MKKLIPILILFLLSFKSGKYLIKDSNNLDTCFVFNKTTGFYSELSTIKEYHYFDWWKENDLIVIVYENDYGVYFGTKKYRLVDNKLIEINNYHTLIIIKNDYKIQKQRTI